MLLDQKLYENISVYNISYKTSTGPKPLHISSRKYMDLLGFVVVSLDIKYYLIIGCLIKFVIGLNIL